MNMSRKASRLLSLLLSLVIVIGVLPITAFAEAQTQKPTTGTVELPTKPGGTENESVDVIIKVETDKTTGTTTTTTETPSSGDTTASGLNVNYTGTEITVTPPQPGAGKGELISADSHYDVTDGSGYHAEGGTEVSTAQSGNSEDDITIGVIKNGEVVSTEPVQGGLNSTTTPTNEGDALKKDNAANFDQTTVESSRTAEVTASKPTIKVGDPTYYDENGNPIEPNTNDGYDYRWLNGTDGIGDELYPDDSRYDVKVFRVKTEEDGTRTESQIKTETVYNMFVCYNNTDDPDDPLNGTVTGGLYCVDLDTGANGRNGYSKINLEDAADEKRGYYTETEAAQLRAIMNNGFIYDGYIGDNYRSEESVEQRIKNNEAAVAELKQNLRSALGKDTRGIDIDSLTWEDAAVATQMAIWSVANRTELQDGETLELKTGIENINALCAYLLTLSESATDSSGNSKETQILSEDRFIDNMDIVIGSMVKDDELAAGESNDVNKDDADDNDLYNVSLKFSLKVTPSHANDDLIVNVLNSKGEVVKTARIAGEGTDLIPDADGYYVLDGLHLQENTDNTFNLKLEGVQYLEEGVYVFQSRIDDQTGSTSQNLIGRFEGEAEIDLSMQFDIRFNVDEGTVTTTREWRKEWNDLSSIQPDGDDDGDDDGKPGDDDDTKKQPKTPSEPSDNIPDDGIPQANVPDSYDSIPDDGAPLANVPKTGDISALWLALTALCGLGLTALAVTDRKRKHA